MPKFLSTVCKFTPLGFETHFLHSHGGIGSLCVNLPRWGLKLRGYGFFHR